MIIYQASKSEFLHHALRDDIEDIVSRQYRHATGHGVAAPEMQAWKHSLLEMAKVLQDEEIPADAGVAIEYQLPQTSKRIDFVITGEDAQARSKVVIVELKQWSESRRSDKDAIVWARRGGKAGEREGPHPSYQAWSYAAYLQDFNTAVQECGMALQPCAYLHNHPRDGEIDHPHYREYMERAPLFLARERARLQAFIRQHVRHGDRKGVLYAIENGRIRPSKMLADSVAGLLQGKPEFVLIDDQKLVYESVLAADARADGRRQVVIVQGGPGTGKSVLAINLLAALLKRGRNARYVSKNAAPRAVYEAKLAGTMKKGRISNLFSGSGAFVETEPDSFDTLIVDEAHRLNEKSGLYRNLGENQVKELIRAARCTVFFVDDDQRVTLMDIGHTEELRQRARAVGAEITELELSSQFRCNGSDGYLAWLDDTLDIRATANPLLDTGDYDFRVFDDPAEMHALIESKNRSNNRSRVVAGYCWTWPSKKNPQAWDIDLPDFDYRRRWNLNQDGSLWIVAPGSVEQVGCIHTCQGLELDYVGVIIGPDMVYRDERVVTDATRRASSDQSVKGLKQMLRSEPGPARELADRIVKNTYRTLMTRGMKGCYVYCTDPVLAQYLRSRLKSATTIEAEPQPQDVAKVVPLRRVTAAERAAGMPAVPLLDLRFAAGTFSDFQSLDDGAIDWVAPPDWIRPQPGMFVAQVVGESMNRRIPNGAWCLFRANPGGTRQGKVVVAQHRSIDDPELGGRYTVKVYSSEKVTDGDGGWRHLRITLRPDSDRPEYRPIELDLSDADDPVVIVAELLDVLE
ncbi:DNA/RNA helicase domain-containing protein [Rubrivivax gelatinosus]|uniref:Putative ATPase n=1 Tax=Rubrivivax gelatinosus (strain NBRC 100245 / IL144) TaxID=983917 RepID=I0HMI9_RUBGI|nr:DNA/RNA helicase domain-containing protein [Rubrivivax gelatinosus]BAL94226.1 putative ATPase [Rubrivivax gelatinosus IL144]